MDKRSLRREFLARRNAMRNELVESLSAKAQRFVIQSPRFLSAKTVGAYMPIGSEVRTGAIVTEAIRLGKRIALPAVGDRGMVFYEYSAGTALVKGRFGVLEPARSGEIADLDFLVVPGLAFDREGRRLGYGKAYYDRFLARCRPYSMGLAYSFQVVERLPEHPHDVRLDAIATDAGSIGSGA